MEGSSNVGLTDSILSTAASMQLLSDELDRISLHSSSELQSSSRESLHSSSKYDSAFDSHYSEDTASFNSQVVSVSYPIDTETSMLPSLLTPPLPYRIVTESKSPVSNRPTRRKTKGRRISNVESEGTSSNPSPSPLVTHQFRRGGQSSDRPTKIHDRHQHRTISHLMSDSSLPTIHQPECIYVEPSCPINQNSRAEDITEIQTAPIHRPVAPSDSTSPATPLPSDGEVTPTKPTTVLRADEEACFLQHQQHLSECSSIDDLISNGSTPTVERRQPQAYSAEGHDEVPPSLNPRVTIIYPNNSASDSDDSPLPQRHNYFPKTGTLFYQESITPRQSPLHEARRHISPTHTLPGRYQDPAHSLQSNGKSVKRSGSILQRLKRKRGSFKEDGLLKRRLPVKRSLSDRMAYNIRKGWIDYVEDLNFISQPAHPRAVGRMIDKKAGRLHVVQLYKPPSGKCGIYISQRGNRKGIYISRFANSTAEKFYTGLISPGDQIIRVNGRNIGEHSVDHVYDLMTASDSVIFTVIPVNFRSDW